MNMILCDDNLELYMFYFLDIQDIQILRQVSKDYNNFIVNSELYIKFSLTTKKIKFILANEEIISGDNDDAIVNTICSQIIKIMKELEIVSTTKFTHFMAYKIFSTLNYENILKNLFIKKYCHSATNKHCINKFIEFLRKMFKVIEENKCVLIIEILNKITNDNNMIFIYFETSPQIKTLAKVINITIRRGLQTQNFKLNDVFVITEANIELKNIVLKTKDKEYDLYKSKFDIIPDKKGIYFKEVNLDIKYYDIMFAKIYFDGVIDIGKKLAIYFTV